jgi:hypothetical protein
MQTVRDGLSTDSGLTHRSANPRKAIRFVTSVRILAMVRMGQNLSRSRGTGLSSQRPLPRLRHLTSECRKLIEVVRPPLHYFPTLWQVLGMVVRGPHLVALDMGQLAFDRIRAEQAALVQHGGCGVAETVARCPIVVPHPVKGIKHSVLAHVLEGLPRIRAWDSISTEWLNTMPTSASS